MELQRPLINLFNDGEGNHILLKPRYVHPVGGTYPALLSILHGEGEEIEFALTEVEVAGLMNELGKAFGYEVKKLPGFEYQPEPNGLVTTYILPDNN